MLLNLVWKHTRNSVRVPSASKQTDFLTGIPCLSDQLARPGCIPGGLFVCSAAFLGSDLVTAKAKPVFRSSRTSPTPSDNIDARPLMLLA